MMKLERPIWSRLLAAVAYLVIAAFLWRYIARLDFDRLRAITIAWPYLLAALPASFLARAILVVGWREILIHYEPAVPRFVVLNNIYATTWLARYVPGKALYYLGKVRLARRHGVKKEDAGLSSALEVVLQLGIGLVVGLILILVSGSLDLIDSGAIWFSAVVLVVAAVALTPAVFNRVVASLAIRLKSVSLEARHYIDGWLLTRLVIIYAAVHITTGVPVLLLLRSVYGNPAARDLPFVTGVVVLSGVLGALALFAPSGIGVRESVQLLLLSAAFPAETVLVLVVLLRAWGIFVDLLYWICSGLAVTFVRKTEAVG